jgi:hypothetical protein
LLYYSKSPEPFADKYMPTVIEIDNWNIEVINHIRNMLGITNEVKGDPRLYLEVAWADERKTSTIWDAKYPGSLNSAYGPCPQPGAQGHCGATFFPDAADHASYVSGAPYFNDYTKYPELADHTTRYSQSEGTGGTSARIPWSLRIAMVITNYILGEGISGHAGPALFRNTVGISWGCIPGGQINGGGISFRAKWR